MVSISQELRQAVLQAAIQGKLTEQLPEDGDARELLAQIKAEKERLIKEKKIKKEKPLAPITEDEVPFDIPENWIWIKLPEVLEIQPSNGKSVKPTNNNKGIKNLTLTATTSGYFKPNAFKYVDIDEKTASNYWLHSGDLLIQRSNSRELVGTSCIFDGKDNEYIYPDLMMRMRVINPVNVKYVDYVLKAPHVRIFYSHSASGTSESMPKINQSIVSNTLIPFPPLGEQYRIVACVEELMTKIGELEKVENELKALYQAFPGDMKAALLQAAMQGKLTEQISEDGTAEKLLEQIKKRTAISSDDTNFDLPDSWQWAVLCDVAEMYTGNSIAENEKTQKYVGLDSGYDYIGTKDVGFDHEIQYNNGVRIPYDAPKFKYAFPEATLLCIEGGSAGRKIALLDRKVCFGNKLCMFYSTIIDKKYLYYYLQSPDFQSAFKNNVSGIIGGVSINKLKHMPIPIPPLAEQHRIVKRLDKLLPLCDSLQTEL